MINSNQQSAISNQQSAISNQRQLINSKMLYVFSLALALLFISASNQTLSQISPIGPIAFPCSNNFIPNWTFDKKKIFVFKPNCDIKVGIGTNNPIANLQVVGSTVLGNTSVQRLKVGKTDEAGLTGMITCAYNSSVPTSSSYPLIDLAIYNPNANIKSSIFKVEPNGNLTLSNGTERIFKINAANRTVYSHEIILLDQQFWPDYVFKKDYNLLTFEELRQFIEKNQHLPNIPKAADVYKDGLSLGEMNKLLLEKVEELTLYMLQQQDNLEALKARIQELEEQTRTTK